MKKFYPLADLYGSLKEQRHLRAIRTGEFRAPRKGEWYLSGAIVEAYRAPNDLTPEYQIAKIVRVETETITRIVEEY